MSCSLAERRDGQRASDWLAERTTHSQRSCFAPVYWPCTVTGSAWEMPAAAQPIAEQQRHFNGRVASEVLPRCLGSHIRFHRCSWQIVDGQSDNVHRPTG